MTNQELIDYIKQQSSQGTGKDEIKSNLINIGWSEEDINKAFDAAFGSFSNDYDSSAFLNKTSLNQKPKNSPVKIIFLVGIFLILGIGASLVLGIWDPFKPASEKVIEEMILKMRTVETFSSEGRAYFEFKENGDVFNFSINSKSAFNNTDSENPKSKSEFNLLLAMEGMQFYLTGENRNIGENSYLKLTTIPALPMLDSLFIMMGINIKELKDNWIKIDQESAKDIFGDTGFITPEMTEEISYDQKEKQEEMAEKVKELLIRRKIYSVKETLPEKEIENKKTYHYVVVLNEEEFKKLIPEILEILENEDFFGVFRSRIRAEESITIQTMKQTQRLVDATYVLEGSYKKLNCDYSEMLINTCKQIADVSGSKPVIFTSDREYCAYVPLRIEGYYYCIDSRGRAGITDYPQKSGYCTGQTFICPETIVISEEERQKAAEKYFSEGLDNFFEKIGEIKAELWIGKKDFYLYKFKIEKEIDIAEFGMKKEGKIVFGIDFNFSNFNKPLKIEAPEEYKTIKEFFTPSSFFIPPPLFEAPGKTDIPFEEPLILEKWPLYLPAAISEFFSSGIFRK